MSKKLILIAGPCVVESEKICMDVAEHVADVCQRLHIEYYFKASYRKANRSRMDSFTGIGDEAALDIIYKTGMHIQRPTLTDIHESNEADLAAKFVDVLQIPAFLCRQTDLLVAAGRTGKIVNIKKGQFLNASSMQFAIDKVRSTGNQNIWLTERGTMMGYQDIVVDYRAIPTMKEMNCPVILDITHSLQQPNQTAGVTGGLPQLIETIAKCGIAAGVDGIFMETHPDPSKALSDGANMLPLHKVEGLLEKLLRIREVI